MCFLTPCTGGRRGRFSVLALGYPLQGFIVLHLEWVFGLYGNVRRRLFSPRAREHCQKQTHSASDTQRHQQRGHFQLRRCRIDCDTTVRVELWRTIYLESRALLTMVTKVTHVITSMTGILAAQILRRDLVRRAMYTIPFCIVLRATARGVWRLNQIVSAVPNDSKIVSVTAADSLRRADLKDHACAWGACRAKLRVAGDVLTIRATVHGRSRDQKSSRAIAGTCTEAALAVNRTW